MTQAGVAHWTNPSVLLFAPDRDPVAAIEEKVRRLILSAIDAGWSGPPFNPIMLAEILGIPVKASSAVIDARTVMSGGQPSIEYNPQQTRERARFSIAHEIAHTFFTDVGDVVRHRGGDPTTTDDWQLELLCNLAAAEMVMPIGSLRGTHEVPPIESLLEDRRRFDVSVEAYLLRVVKAAQAPVSMFVAAPHVTERSVQYMVDYASSSQSVPNFSVRGKRVPTSSVVYHCRAIGATTHAIEDWLTGDQLQVECVGIPGYPGSSLPRVAALVRHEVRVERDFIHFVQGDVLDPRPYPPQIICQLTNDKAIRWGGGVARQAARAFPAAEADYQEWIKSVPRHQRLGEVHYAKVSPAVTIASLVAQEGFGVSDWPRIRYLALDLALARVAQYAHLIDASIHMPRIGTGVSGGDWQVVEGILRKHFCGLRQGIWIYDLPPPPEQTELGF